MNKYYTSGMRGDRSRDENGKIREKRNDTLMGTIENQYNRDFNVRSDMRLGNFLNETGISSLSQLIKSDLGKR